MEFKLVLVAFPLFFAEFPVKLATALLNAPAAEIQSQSHTGGHKNKNICDYRRNGGIPGREDANAHGRRFRSPKAVAVGAVDFEHIASRTEIQIGSEGSEPVCVMPVFVKPVHPVAEAVALGAGIVHGGETQHEAVFRTGQSY